MRAQRLKLSRKSALGLFVTTFSVVTFGGAFEGRAQSALNLETELKQTAPQLDLFTTDVGPLACKKDAEFIVSLRAKGAPEVGLLQPLSEAVLPKGKDGKPLSDPDLKKALEADKAKAAAILQD